MEQLRKSKKHKKYMDTLVAILLIAILAMIVLHAVGFITCWAFGKTNYLFPATCCDTSLKNCISLR
jgi:hypothetical protein